MGMWGGGWRASIGGLWKCLGGLFVGWVMLKWVRSEEGGRFEKFSCV